MYSIHICVHGYSIFAALRGVSAYVQVCSNFDIPSRWVDTCTEIYIYIYTYRDIWLGEFQGSKIAWNSEDYVAKTTVGTNLIKLPAYAGMCSTLNIP